MAEPGARARSNPLRDGGGGNAVSAGRRRDIYLVAQELHLALGQLFALVQLLNPLV